MNNIIVAFIFVTFFSQVISNKYDINKIKLKNYLFYLYALLLLKTDTDKISRNNL